MYIILSYISVSQCNIYFSAFLLLHLNNEKMKETMTIADDTALCTCDDFNDFDK